MTEQEWKLVPGYEGRYEISSLGTVRSVKTGRILPLTKNHKGYLRVSLYSTRGRKTFRVNRLVLRAFVGEPASPNLQAAHLNGVKTDNCVANLAWATIIENARHKELHGTRVSPGAKLVANDVREIISGIKAGVRKIDLARKYGVALRTVVDIARGETWKHLELDAPQIDRQHKCQGGGKRQSRCFECGRFFRV